MEWVGWVLRENDRLNSSDVQTICFDFLLVSTYLFTEASLSGLCLMGGGVTNLRVLEGCQFPVQWELAPSPVLPCLFLHYRPTSPVSCTPGDRCGLSGVGSIKGRLTAPALSLRPCSAGLQHFCLFFTFSLQQHITSLHIDSTYTDTFRFFCQGLIILNKTKPKGKILNTALVSLFVVAAKSQAVVTNWGLVRDW